MKLSAGGVFAIVVALAGAALIIGGAAFALLGCAVPVDVKIGVDLDDDCLLLFPQCYAAGGTECVDSSGAVHPECQVACVAGRELSCDPDDGPLCTQRLGDSDEFVPVVCVGR